MTHDIAYTFTREELTALLEDIVDETHVRYCELRAQMSFRKATDAWPAIAHQEIVAVLQRLDFDATRPAEPPCAPLDGYSEYLTDRVALADADAGREPEPLAAYHRGMSDGLRMARLAHLRRLTQEAPHAP